MFCLCFIPFQVSKEQALKYLAGNWTLDRFLTSLVVSFREFCPTPVIQLLLMLFIPYVFISTGDVLYFINTVCPVVALSSSVHLISHTHNGFFLRQETG